MSHCISAFISMESGESNHEPDTGKMQNVPKINDFLSSHRDNNPKQWYQGINDQGKAPLIVDKMQFDKEDAEFDVGNMLFNAGIMGFDIGDAKFYMGKIGFDQCKNRFYVERIRFDAGNVKLNKNMCSRLPLSSYIVVLKEEVKQIDSQS